MWCLEMKGSLRWMSLLRPGRPRPRPLAPALLIVLRGVARGAAPPLLRREPVLVRGLRPERRAGGIGERFMGSLLCWSLFCEVWFQLRVMWWMESLAATTTRRRGSRGV